MAVNIITKEDLQEFKTELLEEIKKIDSVDDPVLVYSDGYSWDEDGFIHQHSISTEHANNLQDFIMFNGGYQGCSIIMNKSLIELAKRYDNYVHHHDDLVSLIAHTFGKVKFYPKQLMLYRQHGEAVTGNKDFKKRKFYGVFNNAGYVISKAHFRSKTEFYNFFENVVLKKCLPLKEDTFFILKISNSESQIQINS